MTNDSGDTNNSVETNQKASIERRCDSNLCLFGGICDPVTQKCKCKRPYIGKLVRYYSCHWLFNSKLT